MCTENGDYSAVLEKVNDLNNEYSLLSIDDVTEYDEIRTLREIVLDTTQQDMGFSVST